MKLIYKVLFLPMFKVQIMKFSAYVFDLLIFIKQNLMQFFKSLPDKRLWLYSQFVRALQYTTTKKELFGLHTSLIRKRNVHIKLQKQLVFWLLCHSLKAEYEQSMFTIN